MPSHRTDMTHRNNSTRRWTLALAVWLVAAASGFAGPEITHGKDVKEAQQEEVRTWFPDFPPGFVTAGVQFSKHQSEAYLDSITGLWAPRERDAFLFLNSRYDYQDTSQFVSSTGLGFRKIV